ncbi:LOW QUALITY PROTEIN: protein FAM186B [Pipistrellus kuhlii]|uniref:LOW QUALITY PROTEIN: protein FAM186B n=1 Tax=Pipistrellus kuhlii TaxID=59472 RepID=UPI001E272AA3|nr:LOW QUALITY PROTEIN: protein FAM186B [Pipistrellus kuhlii]
MEMDKPPQLVTPASVKAIISRIEAAQLTRAQEDISSQLTDILDNVNCVINRFQEELGYDLKEKARSHQMEQKGKTRFILLEKIASFSKDAKTKEKHLYEILHWLGDWGDSLTYEINNRHSEKEEEGLDEWIEVMEKLLPLSLISTKGGIESLISLCSTLIEGQKKRAQMSKHTLWQSWREQNLQKSTSCPQPLSPEQMLQDKNATCARVSEVRFMLQELLDSTMFNQEEVRAIRYMSAVVENLNKALILQHNENRSLQTKQRQLKIDLTKELSSQRVYFQHSLQALEKKRDALTRQVEALGEKNHDLLLIKHALELQLKKPQSARGEADTLGPLEKEALPEKESAMEESQREAKKEEQLFSPLSPDSTMTAHSRVTDVHSSRDNESLQLVLPSSVDHKFPNKWEVMFAKSPGHKVRDQKDFIQEAAQEKEELQIKSQVREQLSPESSRTVALESKGEHWEEELSWERRRQQWLEQEELWLQRQQKWALLEQEHEEKLRQWAVQEAAKEQQERLVQQKKEGGGPRRELEQPGKDEEMIFVPTNRWRDLEKASPSPPPSRTQSAGQRRRPHLPRTPNTQKTALGNQRIKSSPEFTLKPWTQRVPAKTKKSASVPSTGASVRKATQSSLHISSVTLNKKEYHMDMEAQRKNLQVLRENAKQGLPNYLHSEALNLTTTSMELTKLRLQSLCHKYIIYRCFQSLRQEVINHIQTMRETKATYKAQSLYVFLENIDQLQDLRLKVWTDKQKDLEEKRRDCLSSMATMFPKIKQEWNIHLHTPVVTSPKSRKSKPPPSLLRRVHSSSPLRKQPPEHLPSKHQKRVPLQTARPQRNQMETVWKTDVASSSHPIEKCPDVPQLLALDVHSSFHKSLTSLKARVSATQRKEHQEPSNVSAELVHKKSSESLPGALRSQKDRDNHSPNPSLSQ